MREEDRRAKASTIEAYFSDLKRRVEGLRALYAAGYEDEALLVCCCYIEGLGTNLYWPDQRSARNFVRVLEQYGGEEILWHIHPKQLLTSLEATVPKLYSQLGERITAAFAADQHALRTKEEFLSVLVDTFAPEEIQKLTQHLWRGTVANLVYSNIRSRLVHVL